MHIVKNNFKIKISDKVRSSDQDWGEVLTIMPPITLLTVEQEKEICVIILISL